MALLRRGEYREGLALYEARLDKPTWSGFATAASRAALRGRLLRPGEPVAGRRIVLLAEQGLGDGIMCARYIPLLAERGARIALASNPALRPFFARIEGIETLLSPPPDQPLAQINLTALPFDAWLPLFSLPYWFGTDLTSVPDRSLYWNSDPARVRHWRSRLAAAGRAGRPKIGIVFQTNPAGAGYTDRSMQASDLTPLLELDGIDFVNLQSGPAGRALSRAAPGILDLLPSELPLDDYGAAIAATELLITVDTMATHLSGAQAHATWVAVPYSPQWTWGLNTPTTPWYPTTRIFRQAKARDWSGAIAAMAGALRESFGAAATSAQAVVTGGGRAVNDDVLAGDAAQLDLALAQLRRGELAQGFANYEARQRVALWREQALPLRESLVAVEAQRLKPGDPVIKRRIAVFTEQGLGDTFLGARFLFALAERGAAITLICRAPMRPLFARWPFLDAILSPPQDAPDAKIDLRRLSFDAWCPLLSLPHVLGFAAEAAWPTAPYLTADPAQIAAWRARYRRHGREGARKIGLVWQANRSNTVLANRSLRAADLAPLAQIEGVDFINLQHGVDRNDLAKVLPAIDPMPTELPLDEFAAALAATDLVISVDTMAAHCAGALGHPVFVVLAEKPGWWWGAEGEVSLWYPSARLFRRRAGSDRTDVVATIATVLRAHQPSSCEPTP
jgi:ADP-heptose:LPS heptosyltransferase